MIARLKKKQDGYYCSNCRMPQIGIPDYCYFCGYEFSNWEEIIYNEFLEKEDEEMKKHESNLYGKSGT